MNVFLIPVQTVDVPTRIKEQLLMEEKQNACVIDALQKFD